MEHVDAVAAGPLLGEDEQGDDQHDGDGELGGAAEVRAVDPGGVDHRGEAVDAKILHGAEVVHHLHHGEGDADDQRRAAQRQGDGEEGADAPAPRVRAAAETLPDCMTKKARQAA